MADFARKFPRRKLFCPCTVLYRGGTVAVNLYEIGEGGLGLQTAQSLPVGHHTVINLFLGHQYFGSLAADVVFENMNANSGQGYTVGLKFTNLPFEMKRHIREYVSGVLN